MGAAQKVALKGRGNQPSEGTGKFSAQPARSNPSVGIGSGIAKGIQKKAATDVFRSNDKSNRKGKGPTKRTLPPKPPEDRMSIMPFPGPTPGGNKGLEPDRGPSPGKGPLPINKPVAPPSLMGPPKSGLVIPDAPKDDYFNRDRFNRLQQARNEQRNASENRMIRNDRRRQRKSGLGR